MLNAQYIYDWTQNWALVSIIETKLCEAVDPKAFENNNSIESDGNTYTHIAYLINARINVETMKFIEIRKQKKIPSYNSNWNKSQEQVAMTTENITFRLKLELIYSIVFGVQNPMPLGPRFGIRNVRFVHFIVVYYLLFLCGNKIDVF